MTGTVTASEEYMDPNRSESGLTRTWQTEPSSGCMSPSETALEYTVVWRRGMKTGHCTLWDSYRKGWGVTTNDQNVVVYSKGWPISTAPRYCLTLVWNHETVGKWEKWPQITHSQRCPKFWFSSEAQVFIWYLWKRSPGTSFFPFTTNELAAFWSQFEPSTSHWIPYASVYLMVSQMTIFTSLLHHHIPFLCGHSPCKHVLSLIKKKKKLTWSTTSSSTPILYVPLLQNL